MPNVGKPSWTSEFPNFQILPTMYFFQLTWFLGQFINETGTNMDERTGRNNWTSLNRYGYPKYRPVIYFRSSPEFKFKIPWSKDRNMDRLSMIKYNQMTLSPDSGLLIKDFGSWLRVAQTQAILFLKSTSEIIRSDIEWLWFWLTLSSTDFSSI